MSLQKFITVQYLQEIGACKAGIEAYAAWLGGRDAVQVTRASLDQAARSGLDVHWFLEATAIPGEVVFTDYFGCEMHYFDGAPLNTEIIRPDGTKEYYADGTLHRLDGPARIRPNGDVEYWIAGTKFTEEDFRKSPSHKWLR